MRTVLFIAYNFPPAGGPGVQRSLKFVKYLPQFGWHPVVITVTPDAYPVQDESLWQDVPEQIPVYRTKGYDINGLRPSFNRFHLNKVITALNIFLLIPDAALFWAYLSRRTVTNIIKQHRPVLVYSSSGPASAHLLGLWIKQKFNLPWFADFRDPWSQNLLAPYLPGYRTINQWLEKRVLTYADRVACVSAPWLKGLQENLEQQSEKFLVLPNGYDEDDIQPLPFPSKRDRFTLIYLGSFYRNRRPNKLVEAVRLLVHTNRIPLSKLRVLFVGNNVRQYIPNIPPFEIYDYVPHKELIQFRMQTDAFILLLDTSPENIGTYSGKLFEYLASNRPILGIVPPGGVAQQLIEETRTGISVDNDVNAIATAIEKLYSQWETGHSNWNPNREIIRQYTRRNLTARLAREFDHLANLENLQ